MSTPLGRADKTLLGRWFWTIDRPLLALVLVLIGIGLIAVAAASPAAAHRYSGGSVKLDDMYYFKRQLFWILLGVPVMLGVSMLTVPWAKRLSLIGTLVFIVALAAVPFFGAEANGAVRWLALGGFQLQPSEFLKPLFAVTSAWLLASRFDDGDVPALSVSCGLLVLVVAMLVMQPDIGQSALFVGVWLVQAVLAGMSFAILGIVLAAGAGLLVVAYLFVPHVTSRIDRFLTGDGDTYQIDKALDGFRAGGLFGAGPGEGQNKFSLPEPHTDYIFSVIGEEFGAIACTAIAILFLAMIVRVLLQLLEEEDPFVFLGAAGLITQIGGQAMINIGVNLNLLPSKGMTLPFISHGGSSFLALSMGMGLLLALTRRNRFLKSSPYVPRGRTA
ncbi:FtsW/RodA/SpoVE family cell cycle protein [Sphingosinicella microcystinivorans]|uniref:Probable peptidoglycan glycosyltransferase FtsW n=1 Tax=Sphingosinicella microcystinivorans TaxID=335406 RepID=A0AAD1G2C9_SPHMI|nr:putative peptidoglycan glycosyltransferase FtsW [Sphingosinicella microcystinivorans]RKS88066.1 cell division protein FtsW [Sphingosinicella microcystinivorans]BBE35877.1 cell division protein FtsW [Sphingosinicella microcystinivorans]